MRSHTVAAEGGAAAGRLVLKVPGMKEGSFTKSMRIRYVKRK